jgi:hypothetical protein
VQWQRLVIALLSQVSQLELVVKVEGQEWGRKAQVKPQSWTEAQEKSMEVQQKLMGVWETPLQHAAQ